MGRNKTYSPRASLALIGQRFQTSRLWSIVEQQVHIPQKVRQYPPLDKLLDVFILIIAGGVGIVEVNTRVRSDPVLLRSFGLRRCPDQSTISTMLSACTPETVEGYRAAWALIFQRHARSMRHDPVTGLLRLDVDMMGLPTQSQGEGVCKGYFGAHRARRGRQVGRVVASAYGEIVVERLYAGGRQLEHSLPELVEAAEQLLCLDAPSSGSGSGGGSGGGGGGGGGGGENRRENTLICMDAGGGSDGNIDWLLTRGYWVLTKVHSWQRARKLAQSVTHWVPDPKQPKRSVGWPTLPHAYTQLTRQLALDYVDEHGKHRYSALVSNLSDDRVGQVIGQPAETLQTAPWLLLHAYDTRGGGVETQNRTDQQGLGLAKRHAHSFAAQEMLVLTSALAHNFLMGVHRVLAAHDPRVASYGVKRLVRDVFHIPGQVRFDAQGHLASVRLDPDHVLAAAIQAAAPYLVDEM